MSDRCVGRMALISTDALEGIAYSLGLRGIHPGKATGIRSEVAEMLCDKHSKMLEATRTKASTPEDGTPRE